MCPRFGGISNHACGSDYVDLVNTFLLPVNFCFLLIVLSIPHCLKRNAASSISLSPTLRSAKC